MREQLAEPPTVPKHDVPDNDEAPAVAEHLQRKIDRTPGAFFDHERLQYKTSLANLNRLQLTIRREAPWAKCASRVLQCPSTASGPARTRAWSIRSAKAA